MKELQIRYGEGAVVYVVDGTQVSEEVFNQGVIENGEEERINLNIQDRIKKIAIDSLIAEGGKDQTRYEDERGKLEIKP